MKSLVFKILILIFPATVCLKAQDDDAGLLLKKSIVLYGSGDFAGAGDCLLSILNSKDTIGCEYLIPSYNNLGAIYQFTGRYNEALENYNNAEKLIISHAKPPEQLASIYNNKALIYENQKSYPLAIEYYEKGIRIFSNQNDSDTSKFSNLSSAFLNIGITQLEIGKYQSALEYLNNSAHLRLKYKLPGLDLVNLNLANAFAKTGNQVKAEEYYKKSITGFETRFGKNYFRLWEVYSHYGIFLRSIGENDKSLSALQKSLSISFKNYNAKHPHVSRAYSLIGDHYQNLADYDSALIYYQKAIIAVVKDFNNRDIFSNPAINSSLFDIQLLTCMKSKAQVLELLAGKQLEPEARYRILAKSLETVTLAIQLIERIRKNYPSEESKIYLAENEKPTYIFATHLASNLLSSRTDAFPEEQMYSIANKAKAAILRNEISENEMLRLSVVPDSLRKRQSLLAGNIGAYNYLILDELRKADPDENKIIKWKDALFEMNRENEKVSLEINQLIPQYQTVLQMTEPDSVVLIQKRLKPDETIIDYLLSNRYENGRRKLYTFVITKRRIDCSEAEVDSLFALNADIIRRGAGDPGSFLRYTTALNYMYEKLIKPSEDMFAGDKLIVIPDEEIAWLPFDAFLKNKPEAFRTDFEDLSYLIHDYTFSYGYSSSLVFSKNNLNKEPEVFSFSPGYSKASFDGMGLGILNGADKEIESIYNWFKGKKFTGSEATEKNFLKSAENAVVFHLAMHALPDSSNSRYSYFLFDTDTDSTDDGKLYNYEISLTRLNSPMVVLSSCNSGTGTLNEGEGLMSLARGFILAGASSVIKTAWEVNDEVSASIMTRFYYHLSKGKHKNEAMRLAKLEYLKNASPTFADPYYWAAYEVMGDNAPITQNQTSLILLFSGLLAIAILIAYLNPRRIFSDRLL